MRFFFALILFFALCVLPSDAAFIDGQDYVPLSGWAHANGFRLAMDGTEILLTGKTSQLVFESDSVDAKINGINVRLSFPVAKGGLISELDLQTAVKPLVFPQRLPGKRITTICLDPGHGGKDTGNRVGHGIFAHNEKAYTLPLALELRDQLRALGFNVILTRSSDTYVELPERPAIANRAGADLFISLHFNASPQDKNDVEGPETYCITPVGANSSNAGSVEFSSGISTGPTVANRVEDKSLLLAWEIQKSLVQSLHTDDRGVRRARFAVLRDAQMPAILVEGGYMSNPVEGKKIYSADYRRQMAAAIVRGILAYQKAIEPPVYPPPSPGKDLRRYPSPREE